MILNASAAEGLVVVGLAAARLVAPSFGRVAFDRRNVERRRQDSRSTASSSGCTPLLLERRATQDGQPSSEVQRPSSKRLAQLRLVTDGVAIQVSSPSARRRSPPRPRSSRSRASSASFGEARPRARERLVLCARASRPVPADNSFMARVDRSGRRSRRLRRRRQAATAPGFALEALTPSSRPTRSKSAPTRSILLMNAMTRHSVAVGLAPDRLGLRLDTAYCTEHGDGSVQHAQRTFDFNGEVDVAGCVDDVDTVVIPEALVVAAEVIVMPRSCSCSIQSMVAAPSCTSPSL